MNHRDSISNNANTRIQGKVVVPASVIQMTQRRSWKKLLPFHCGQVVKPEDHQVLFSQSVVALGSSTTGESLLHAQCSEILDVTRPTFFPDDAISVRAWMQVVSSAIQQQMHSWRIAQKGGRLERVRTNSSVDVCQTFETRLSIQVQILIWLTSKHGQHGGLLHGGREHLRG